MKMGKRRNKAAFRSQTLPSSPSHSFSSSSSSSSSDFEFTISHSPRKATSALCPADELFYKGKLLPLYLSPRISMVRTLILASSSTSSSSDTTNTTTASRDSTGSSTDSQSSFASDLVLLGDSCDSSRPSSVTEDEAFRRLNGSHLNQQIKKNKYFSFSRFSSVFKKENKIRDPDQLPGSVTGSSVKRVSTSAREVIRKYLKKVKPLYEKLSQKQQQKMSASSGGVAVSFSTKPADRSAKDTDILPIKSTRKDNNSNGFSHSFSGNLRYPRRRSCIGSCPSSMRSSPSHSGVLVRGAVFSGDVGPARTSSGPNYIDTSSMEELQSAIQSAIAHCKNSLLQSNTMVSNKI